MIKVVLILGIVTLIVACVLGTMNWTQWNKFRTEKQANYYNYFTYYLIALCISALLLLGPVTARIFSALGKSAGAQYIMGFVVCVLIYVWSRVVSNWSDIKTRESYTDTWELAWAGTVGPGVLAALLIPSMIYG